MEIESPYTGSLAVQVAYNIPPLVSFFTSLAVSVSFISKYEQFQFSLILLIHFSLGFIEVDFL